MVNAAGVIDGAITNQDSGSFTVGGNLVGNSTFDNNGTATLNVTGGNFTGITTLTNNSTAAVGIGIGGGFTLSAGAVTNAAGATIVDSGHFNIATTLTNS